MRTRKKSPRQKPAPLSAVLKYRNARVVNGFLRKYRMPRRSAEQIYDDMLRWMWLVSTAKQPLPVIDPMVVIDEMWHQFILHTREYKEFCRDYLGRFIEHDPETLPAPKSRKAREAMLAELEAQLDSMIDLVADRFGVKTAKRWFVTYGERYSPRVMDDLRVVPEARPE